jgi:hypothetical protein
MLSQMRDILSSVADRKCDEYTATKTWDILTQRKKLKLVSCLTAFWCLLDEQNKGSAENVHN